MRKAAFFLLSLLVSVYACATDTTRKHEVFLELGGNSLVTALNFHHRFSGNTGLGFRIGAGSYYFKPFKAVVPAGLVYRLGLKSRSSFIDVCAGVTWTNDDRAWLYTTVKIDPDHPLPDKYFIPVPIVSWFHQARKKLDNPNDLCNGLHQCRRYSPHRLFIRKKNLVIML